MEHEEPGIERVLTDSALSGLDLEDLLVELLGRVRDLLAADTAAVLLLDDEGDELVARAACGIEDEVRQGVRVPLGRGFAGRIAAAKRPMRLERVDATTVTNPILWEKGIEVMAGAPLLSGDTVLGVIHVGRLERRTFTDDDVELLEMVADRMAGSIRNRQLAIEQAAANLLERSLMPTVLPRCPGLEFAARYVAAEERSVGGDWYDLFTVPSGQLWVVLGDVAGHGLHAAVVMGRIRSALRAYTMLDLPPEQVLDLVDRKVSHFEIGTIATVAVAVTEPPFDTVTVALAGHPPPVIAAPKKETVLSDAEAGPPLGVGLGTTRTARSFAVEPGAVMVFYTDGLVERRDESLSAGLRRLCKVVEPDHPESVARTVMRELVGSTPPRDDIALVVVRRVADEADSEPVRADGSRG
jgi:hypothetical protein